MSTPPKNRRPLRATLLAAALAASLASGAGAEDPEDPYQPDPCDAGEPCSGEDKPIVHPLRGAARPDGSVPVLDVKNAPRRRRYAVADSEKSLVEGQVTESSGVLLLPQHLLSAAERATMTMEKREANGGPPPVRDETASPKIGPELAAALDTAPPGQPLPVHLRLQESVDLETANEAIQRAIARGEVRTRGDEHRKREDLLERRRQLVHDAQEAVVQAVLRRGGQVTARYQNLFGLSARLTPGQVRQIARVRGVERMDLAAASVDAIHGQHMALGTQINQFLNFGWDGENGDDTDITFAVVENGKVHDDHPGFVDSSDPSSDPRIRARYDCDNSGCSSSSNFTGAGSHATNVNGIVWGDLRDGQDSSVTDDAVQKQKSGYAPESRGYVYAMNYTSDGFREAVDHLFGRSYMPHVVNFSNGFDTEDLGCQGDNTYAKDLNDLFEEGMLPIKSAGNTPGSSTNCTVSSPGAAIGSFTVGSHGDDPTGGDASDVTGAAISSFSSMGGVSDSQGVNRSIIAVTAYGCRDDLFDTAGGYSNSGCGTSFAAPTVTAAALDHVDFYKNNTSDLVDDPGVLHAQLLLMGDREGQSGNLSSEFDSLWGAGRLKMRKLDTEGMDTPYGWGNGYTCVDDGQTVTIEVNEGNTLSSDVNYLKAVIYWYDPRHEDGKSVSDVDLRLKTTSGTTLRSSINYYDNKERVFSTSVGGQAVKLEITGWDVPTDRTSCGNNSMKVYYAYFWEDGDRDDADGPTSLIDPE